MYLSVIHVTLRNKFVTYSSVHFINDANDVLFGVKNWAQVQRKYKANENEKIFEDQLPD